MKVFCRPTAVSAAVLVLAMVCSIVTGQTKLDMRSQARNIDFSAASSTSPFPVGTVLPPICTIGQTFYKSNAAPGQNLYFCTATNIWTVGSGSGDSLPTQLSHAGRLLGSNGTSAAWRKLRGFTDDGSQLLPDGTVMAEVGGNNTWTGHHYFPASTTQTLSATWASIACNRRTIAINSPAALTLASTATIPDGVNGQVCVIVNVGSSPITLQDQAILPSSNLQLIATQVTIRPKGQIALQFNSIVGDWIQEGIPPTSTTGLQDTTATGLVAQTGASGITAARTITGMNGVTVNNGNGVSGNPTISMPGSIKGDLVVHDGTGNTRLGGGSDGQMLVADAGQSAGMKWATRTITGVNGLNIANGDWANGSAATIGLPGTTKGDLIVHDGATNVRVGGGSDGQTLVADASQSAGMKWATRTITGANGLSIANGDWATGSPATISLPGTTKGDLIVHDGATNVRVGGGSDGQTLVADASQSAGVKWTTRSIAGANGLSIANGDWATGSPATISLPGAAKGNLIVHNGTTNVALAAGANGQILTADSTHAAGVKWAAASTSKFLLASVWSGPNRQLAASQTSYLSAAGGLGSWAADVYLTSFPLASAYTLSKACVKTYMTQSSTGSLVLTLMSDAAGNGTFAATPITITIPAGQTQGIFCDTSNTFTNNAGDQIVWRAVNSASAASTYIYSITMEAVAQ